MIVQTTHMSQTYQLELKRHNRAPSPFQAATFHKEKEEKGGGEEGKEGEDVEGVEGERAGNPRYDHGVP